MFESKGAYACSYVLYKLRDCRNIFILTLSTLGFASSLSISSMFQSFRSSCSLPYGWLFVFRSASMLLPGVWNTFCFPSSILCFSDDARTLRCLVLQDPLSCRIICVAALLSRQSTSSVPSLTFLFRH